MVTMMQEGMEKTSASGKPYASSILRMDSSTR